ncbi:hypothetical protein K6L44_03935, partial [Gluconacetobacter entanii]
MEQLNKINFSILEALSKEIKELAKCRTFPFALLYMHHQLLIGGSTMYFSIDKRILNYMISCLYIERKQYKELVDFNVNEHVYVYNRIICIRQKIGEFIINK